MPRRAVSYSAHRQNSRSIPHILKNLGDILGVLDTYYTGPIILLGFYNPDSFVLPGSDGLQEGDQRSGRSRHPAATSRT